MDFESARKEIMKWYNGYRFSPDSTARVVNPVSLGKLFSPGGRSATSTSPPSSRSDCCIVEQTGIAGGVSTITEDDILAARFFPDWVDTKAHSRLTVSPVAPRAAAVV